jgi:hypothetical protein
MKVYLVVIAIHEEPYIHEFVTHYLSLGIDRIVLYDNHPSATLSVYSEHPKIEYIHYPGKQKQMPAYIDFMKRCHENPSEAPDFVGYIDVDEFLFLKRHSTIQEFLGDFGHCSGVAIPWRMFGSNGLTSYDPRPVTVRFPNGAESTHSHFKSFVRPMECMKLNNPHFFYTTRGTRNAADTKTLTVAEDHCEDPGDVAVLNHYFTKSFREFLQKRARGRSDIADIRSIREFFGRYSSV